MMQRLVQKYSYKKMKWGMIALTAVLAVLFIITVVLAVRTQIQLNSYTTITM